MNPFQISLLIAMILLSMCILAAMYRLIKGPSLPDRINSFDLITANIIGIIAIYSAFTDEIAFIDAAIILSLIAFLSSMFFAYYLVKKK